MFITCPELSKTQKIRHGFFTRNGGVSTGLYTSLNCGPGSGDSQAAVAENRARVAAALHAQSYNLITCYQIHSADVVTVEKPWQHSDAPQADAMVTNVPGITLGILTADCLPVLFADSTARVIGAAHAGWKGAFSGVLENTVEKMEELGAKKAHITASIGPAIAQDSYEVGAEFLDRFTEQATENKRFFKPSSKPSHYLFDLKSYAKSRLLTAGITHINILADDTRMQEDAFFSFRRATLAGEPVYGRQISALVLEA